MDEMREYFIYINNLHWGTNWYQWFFYAGVLLTIILEKDKAARSIFGWFPVLFLLGIFNPLFYHAIYFVWPNPFAYYARMFSFIPLLFCIALGLMQLIKKVKTEWIKIIALFAVSTIIIIGGDNFYSAPWMTQAKNIEKVPEGAMEVVEILKKENHIINVAVPDPLNVYIRQIDANLITPYGRRMNELGTALSQEIPDVSYVMMEAGKEAVDYIVVHNNSECKDAFMDYNYMPCAETDLYLIYKVSNVPYTRQVYNDKRQIIAETTYDEEDNVVENILGIATTVYEYDENGFRKKETYYDKYGEKVPISNTKYTSVQREYYIFSTKLASLKYLDVNDNPVLSAGRYETRYTYNNIDRRLIQEFYYDQTGQPMNRADALYASKKFSYDSQGRINGEQYYDLEGNPTICSFGYASYVKELDQNSIVIKEKYYGLDGQPIRIPVGYAAYERELNDEGKLVSELYYGVQGELLGQVGENVNKVERFFQFCRCTEGTSIQDDGSIEMKSIVPQNNFSAVFFLVYNAITDEYMGSFGIDNKLGDVNGIYVHELPSGLYNLRLKANGTLADEWIQCLMFIEEGDRFRYNYTIDEFEERHITISNLSFASENMIEQ